MDKLSDQQRDDALERLSDWQAKGEAITRTFHLRDFARAIDFVNAVAEMAEDVQPPPRHRHPLQQGHDHPDDAQRRRPHAQRHRAGRGHRRHRRRGLTLRYGAGVSPCAGDRR